MTNPKATRPVFKILAGVLVVLAWGTMIEMISLNLLGDMPAHTRWMGYVGMTTFALTTTLATIRSLVDPIVKTINRRI